MSRLASLDLGLISSDSQIMDRVVYTVNSQCMTESGRVEFDHDLLMMDPDGMVVVEAVGWCRTAHPFRSVLTNYDRFARRVRVSLRDRLGVQSADKLLRGLP